MHQPRALMEASGMLPEAGADLEVSQGTTGQAVTAYALGVPLGSLPGHAAGWRGPFAVLTALPLAAVALLALVKAERLQEQHVSSDSHAVNGLCG